MSTNAIIHPARLREVDTFPSSSNISIGDLFSLKLGNNTTNLTHGMHRFPAKYIPQIPRWAIAEHTARGCSVLDPFMGSGTTLVEALITPGIRAYGLDLDPLARMITRAKIGRHNIERLEKLSKHTLDLARKPKNSISLPMKGVANSTHWFNENNFLKLSSIYSAIVNLDENLQTVEFFLVVFSSIIRYASNADDQSQKTYVSGTLPKNPPDAYDLFSRALRKALESAKLLASARQSETECTVRNGDALNIDLTDASIDLIVTSPPYLDSVDYMYNFMLEYFWVGPHLGIETRDEFNERRKNSVGSKNPGIARIPKCLEDMVCVENAPKYRQKAIRAYFESMAEHFREASRVLKMNGTYTLIIGNSQTENETYPVHDCLIKLASEHGLVLDLAFAYRIRRHYMKFPRKGRGGIILMDWVINLKKTTRRQNFSPLPIPDVKIGMNDVAH